MATRKNGKTQPSTSSKIKGRNPIFENFYFEPKTQTQAEAIIDFDSGKNLILSGFAGTGKTMIALALALRELSENRVRKICIFRSSVSSRDIGFLPGTEEEKMEVYEKAVKFLTNKLLRRDDAQDCLKYSKSIHFASTSFERGVTYDDTIIIVDECQNCSVNEINTLATRVGKGSRIIFSGDSRQCDTFDSRGFDFLLDTGQKMKHFFNVHEFGPEDIMRSSFVKSQIITTTK